MYSYQIFSLRPLRGRFSLRASFQAFLLTIFSSSDALFFQKPMIKLKHKSRKWLENITCGLSLKETLTSIRCVNKQPSKENTCREEKRRKISLLTGLKRQVEKYFPNVVQCAHVVTLDYFIVRRIIETESD